MSIPCKSQTQCAQCGGETQTIYYHCNIQIEQFVCSWIHRSPGILWDSRHEWNIGRVFIQYVLSKSFEVFVRNAAEVLAGNLEIREDRMEDYLFTQIGKNAPLSRNALSTANTRRSTQVQSFVVILYRMVPLQMVLKFNVLINDGWRSATKSHIVKIVQPHFLRFAITNINISPLLKFRR